MSIGSLAATVRLSFFTILLVHVCCGQLFDETKKLQPKQLMLSYGAAHDSFSLAFILTDASEEVVSAEVVDYDKNIITNVEVGTRSAGVVDAKQTVNVTCEFSFESKVGVTDYTVSLKTSDKHNAIRLYKMSGQYTVAGLVLYSEDGEIVSGEQSKGISFQSYEEVLTKGSKSLRILSQKPASSEAFDASKVKVLVKPMSGTANAGILDKSSLTMHGEYLYVSPMPYRVSDVPQIATLIYPDFEVDGETFETVLVVSVPNTKVPPPVVTGPTVVNTTTNSEKLFEVRFFNLMSPPQKKAIKSVTVMAEKDGEKVTIALANYNQVKHEGGIEVLKFRSLPLHDSGIYPLKMMATFEDGTHVSCHLEEKMRLRVARSDTGTISGLLSENGPSGSSGEVLDGQSGPARIPLLVLGVLAGAAVVLFVLLAVVRYHRQRSAENMESSFSKSGPSGVPGEFGNCGGEFVLRDSYARTESGYSAIDFDNPQEQPEMTRNRSEVSSQYSM